MKSDEVEETNLIVHEKPKNHSTISSDLPEGFFDDAKEDAKARKI